MSRLTLRGNIAAATLDRMPRKPKNQPAEQPKPSTGVVRLEADLVRMLNIISTATGQDVSEILSPQVRAFVERRYAEVVQQLGREIEKKN
jgi:hypothetical protein